MHWDTIGFKKNKKYFEDILDNMILGHAYVFWGEDMIGKRTFAMELCSKINGDENGFDLSVIAPKISEGETKIYIEDARDLKSFLSLKPLFGKYKIAVIDDAERLTTEAANAILKILEEPPSSGLLILVTSKPKALPKTIYSRCHHVFFSNHSLETAKEYLTSHKLKKNEAEFILNLSHGRIGWISRVIESGALGKIKTDIEIFEKTIKMGVFEKMNFAKAVFERDDRADYLNNLIYYFSGKDDEKMNNRKILAGLLKTYSLLNQPQYNHRLVLENFLLSLN